ERFRGIARDLQKAQAQPGARKGALVEYVLDADAQLKDSDQGRSFYSFWEFLLSPSQSDELKSLLAQVADLPELRSALSEDYLLMACPAILSRRARRWSNPTRAWLSNCAGCSMSRSRRRIGGYRS